MTFTATAPPGSELQRYLDDKTRDIMMLEKYPLMKNVFVQQNCTLPSSAPVELMFSTASLVFTVRHARLSDTLLEHLFLLKSHHHM